MNKQEALDALYTVLVDGITPDDISFTEEEHTQAVLAWNYFRKDGASERNRWLADIDEMLKVVEDNLVHGPSTEHERGWKNALLSLKARRMEATK